MSDSFSKQDARRLAYRRLRERGAARFPFPIEGRIPNFKGAEAAAAGLRGLPLYRNASTLKVNPDSPQLPIRAMALMDGKTLYMPTPRLRGAFLRIRPEDVPPADIRKAAGLKHCGKYGKEIPLTALAASSRMDAAQAGHTHPGSHRSDGGAAQAAKGGGGDRPKGDVSSIDLIVSGSVAVTRRGARAGKGEGYGDLEYAILRELGHPDIPVVTTVHPTQIVEHFPVELHDLSLDVIITPDEVIATDTTFPKPQGIDWDRLTPQDLEEMPVLSELRRLHRETFTVDDLLIPDLNGLFVGLNPGRVSAGSGHHFAGPGNHFWRLLYETGFTPRRLRPDEEDELLRHGVGITNVVTRASRGEADLAWEEFVAGGAELREKVAHFRPRVVALLGKQVYRAYAGLPKGARVEWGVQPAATVPGVKEVAAPNPSSRSTVPYETRLELFREVNRLATAAR